MGKKKMTKEERKRFEAEKAEALRIEMEKERQRQLEEERQQKLKQLTEAKERKKREKSENKMRRVQLAESCDFYKQIRRGIENIYEERRKLREWKRYMRCDGLPNAFSPGDIRKFMHMWQLENDRFNANEQNWLLKTDERTILTQNRDIENATRIHLQQQQPILGDLYAKRTKNVLGILNEIEEAITEPVGISKSIVEELNRLKFELRQKMAQCIDEFCFKILSNIDRDMKLEGLLIATHFYECDVFKSHLWTKRDIPLPLLNEKERQKEAKNYINIDFASLRLNLCLPPTVKCKNGAIRGMWLKFDHFSDFCPSYEMPGKTACHFDLSQAAKIEWKKRKELEKENTPEPEPKSKSHQTNADGAVPFDNFELTSMPIVDVDKLYLDYVTELMQQDRLRKGVKALNLKEFEINLRQYRIVGGVYCLDYFEQPEQSVKLSSKSFLRTMVGSSTLRRRQFFQYYRAPPPTLPGVRRPPEEVEAEMKTVERGLSKLAYITIKLPDDIIWFEPPTVCRWETMHETEVSEKIESKPNNELTKQRSVKKMQKQLQNSEIVIEDFDMLRIPSKIDINFIMQEVIVPRLPDGYTIALSDLPGRRQSFAIGAKVKEQTKIVKSAADFLVPTGSPRPLHPKLSTKTKIKIIERPQKVDACSSEHTEFLFSKLVQDLDEILDKQIPQVERQMDEISEMLSASVLDEQNSDSSDSDQQLDEMSYFKSDEYVWGISKKPETVKETIEPSDESEDEDSDESDPIVENDAVDRAKKNTIGRWSTRDVHDPKFNEEKLALQYRAGRLGCFGLAVNWYANLPFQTWECKPDLKVPGTIFFSLTAAVVSIEITITEGGIILNSFQGGTSSLVQEAYGNEMCFTELNDLLCRIGINMFPDSDAFCYCDALCEKEEVMESHLYECMAHMGLTHNFMWSRWNGQLNSRSMVLLVRELIEKKKTPTFSTLYVTPLKACLVDCLEVSTSFTPTPLPDTNQEFYADLYHLGKDISQPISITKQNAMNPLLRDNFSQILKATRPLSFS